MPTHTSLKGVTSVNSSLLNDQLENNIASYFDWAMLGIGGFANISIPTSGVFGGNMHQLQPTNDKRYNSGQVWQGFRQNWVYESGIEYSSQPINISGIFVNGAFRPKDTPGNSGYIINYPLGLIVFNSGIPLTSTVTLNYSYKYVNFTTTSAPWFRELQTNSYRVDDSHFRSANSGEWSIFGQNRVQLPVVVVEAVPSRSFTGAELGGGHNVRQDIYFHILTETPYDRNQLIDIISYQIDKTIYLYDRNYMRSAGLFPLDRNGSLASGARTYVDLVKASGDGGAFWKKATFMNMSVFSKNVSPGIYGATVRASVEVHMPTI